AEVALLPNGIAFGRDDRLYVAESVAQRIWVYAWSPAGLGPAELFCVLPDGYPDGFCLAATRDLIVSGCLGDAIFIFDERGQLVERYQAPRGSAPTNCCLGDGQLYVSYSSSGQLVAYPCDQPALALYPGRG